MKVIKILGVMVISIVILFLIVALIAPSENHVHRSVVIDAPLEAVHANVKSFEGMLKWSPWHDRDPNLEYSIENDGQEGAVYYWSGEDSLVGEGSQTIVSLSDDAVVTHLHFVRPWESDAEATTTIKQGEEGVEVTWAYKDHTPYPLNAMNLMFNMDEMLGPDFKKGVDQLKSITEEEAATKHTFRNLEVNVEEMAPRMYIGVIDTISWDEMEAFFAGTFEPLFKKVGASGLQIVGMPSAVYFEWNEEERSTIVMAGVPVLAGSIDGLQTVEVSGKALVVDHYGPYEGTGEAHLAIEEYMKWHGVEMGEVAIEEYVTDPEEESDPSKWLTKVYYPVGG